MANDIVAEAWNGTKAVDDPLFEAIREVAFRDQLLFQAFKVMETGTAISPFEVEVLRLMSADRLVPKVKVDWAIETFTKEVIPEKVVIKVTPKKKTTKVK